MLNFSTFFRILALRVGWTGGQLYETEPDTSPPLKGKTRREFMAMGHGIVHQRAHHEFNRISAVAEEAGVHVPFAQGR